MCVCVCCRLIQSRSNSQMALTVSMKDHCLPSASHPPPQPPQPAGGDRAAAVAVAGGWCRYSGCPVTLQRVKTAQFGRANQRWIYDDSVGLIAAFSADTVDKGKHTSLTARSPGPVRER